MDELLIRIVLYTCYDNETLFTIARHVLIWYLFIKFLQFVIHFWGKCQSSFSISFVNFTRPHDHDDLSPS